MGSLLKIRTNSITVLFTACMFNNIVNEL